MRWVIIFLLGILAIGCAKPAFVCNAPYLQVGDQCCLNANNNTICDTDESQKIETLPIAPAENHTIIENIENVTVELPKEEQLSITEEYAKTFARLANDSWEVWAEDPYYGRVWMWGHYDLIKLTNPQHLFLIDNTTMTLNTSQAEIDADQEILFIDVHERKLNYADYAWWNLTSGELGACYVYYFGAAGSYYIKKNCVEDNTTKADGSPTGTQIIWENLTFAHRPMTPLDWLHKFDGQTPIKMQYNRTFVAQDWDVQMMVDYLFFDNYNGTITKLYINQKYKIPMRVELIKDGKVIWYQEYRAFTATDVSLKSYYRTFTEEI